MRHSPWVVGLVFFLLGFNGFYFCGTMWRLIKFNQDYHGRRQDMFILLYLALQGLVVGSLW